MAEHVIKMPDIGEGIAEVELVAWHVKPGDTVVEDQTLADVMTDKANVEIPSPVNGTVVALGGEVGQVMAVGSELIRIDTGGATAAAPPLAGSAKPLPPQPAEPSEAPMTTPTPTATTPEATIAAPVDRPVVPAPRATPATGDRPIASPAVRRRAWELGVDLADVVPSGPGGRILKADLDVAPRRLLAAPAAAGAAATAPAAVPTAAARADAEPRPDVEAVPVIGLRRRIAQKMQEAKRRIPHFSYVEEVDVGELEALRRRLNERWGAERGRLTVLPFLMRAIVLAVRDYPQMNARFDDEAGVVTRHASVHLGIATQTDSGLMVPVVRRAESRDLWGNAAELARLAEAARAHKATRDELAGSTITISSLGALGGIVTTPVINHPEVAIVGVNRIVERPVMRGGAVVARPIMNLSSSFDHRVVDGLHAAEFVQALRGYLETPATLFVE